MKKTLIPTLAIAFSLTAGAVWAGTGDTGSASLSQNRLELPAGVTLETPSSLDITRDKLLQKTTHCTINGRADQDNVMALAELRIYSPSNYPELIKMDPSLDTGTHTLTLYLYSYSSPERKTVKKDSFPLLALNADGSLIEAKSQIRTGNVVTRDSKSKRISVTLTEDGKVKSINFNERIVDSTLSYLLPTKGNSIQCEF